MNLFSHALSEKMIAAAELVLEGKDRLSAPQQQALTILVNMAALCVLLSRKLSPEEIVEQMEVIEKAAPKKGEPNETDVCTGCN